MSDDAAEQFIARLVGDSQGVADGSAGAEGNRDVDLTLELSVINGAIVVDVFINDDGWAGRCAGARAVIEHRTVTAFAAVASRVSHGRGDDQVSAGCRWVNSDRKAIVYHVLRHWAVEDDVAVLVRDGDSVTHFSARA